MKVLVTGGARSGKSRFAQQLAESLAPDRLYVATARVEDPEMAARVRRHKADRGAGWTTLERPLELAGVLRQPGVVLVDCLTLWLSNQMFAQGEDADLWPSIHELSKAFAAAPGHVVLVTNEVGQGIVPMNKVARRFRDWSGWLSQAMAREADTVVLTVAGLPLYVKGGP